MCVTVANLFKNFLYFLLLHLYKIICKPSCSSWITNLQKYSVPDYLSILVILLFFSKIIHCHNIAIVENLIVNTMRLLNFFVYFMCTIENLLQLIVTLFVNTCNIEILLQKHPLFIMRAIYTKVVELSNRQFKKTY